MVLRYSTRAIVLLLLVSVGTAVAYRLRWTLWAWLPPAQRIGALAGLRGVSADHDVRITMSDGVRLATSVYLPRGQAKRRPTILIRLPYKRLEYGEGYQSALEFARNGYAVVVQDLRGTGESDGELLPWRDVAEDGARTLDWIVAQPWSNGRVGTFGCSALGETQLVLARINHPAHRAMIASGAGGAAGSVGGRYGYFGLFEGGVFQLASGFGWFVHYGSKNPQSPPARPFDVSKHLRKLPVSSLVKEVRPYPNGYSDFLSLSMTDPRWEEWGYWTAQDRSRVPLLSINTWGDQTLGETLALSEVWLAEGVAQKVVIGPGNHCEHDLPGMSAPGARFGDLGLQGASFAWWDLYRTWFDRWLKDGEQSHSDAENIYTYFMLGENRWLSATRWPPIEAHLRRWVLASDGDARSSKGNGRLSTQPTARSAAYDEFRYDPLDPVPTRGGPVCCTGNAEDRPGPADQREVEERNDVLIYTSEPLVGDLRIAGPIRTQIVFSSSAPDTDLVVRLSDVSPDGRSTSVQEGSLRLRYRDGFRSPQLLEAGKPVIAQVDLRSIAYTVARGQRLRLHVTSSSFPRLERNLNTGAPNNSDEVRAVIATNRVHHGRMQRSWLELSVLPNAD